MRLSLLLLLAFSSALIAQKQISDFTGWLTSETNTRTESQSGEVAETATTSPVATDSTLNVEVCFGEAYIFGEDTLTVSGQYQAVFTDVNGADSTVTLNLEVLPFSGSELNVGICPGESFVFDGDTLTTGGVYNALYTDSNGCDSLVTLNLTNLNHSEPVNLSVTICSGEVYLIGEDALSETGLYSLTLANSVGCDSVVNLDLTVRPDSISTTTLEASFCSGDNYEFNGDILTAGGVYTAILQNSSGCDSIITLELTALETSLTSVDATICAGETYSFEGQDYTETGIYSAVYTNAAGCDSTVTLNLTVQPADYGSSVQATICGNETYAFNGELLNTSGIYAAGLTSIYGCDSTVTLTLNVLPVSETTLEASFCAGDFYEFNGDTLTEGGVYTDVQTNSVGCDSIITLNLVELATSETTIEASICAETTYTFDGQELSESGIYTASYTNEAGCDSTVTLDLTVLPVLETFLTATICGDSIYDFNGEPLTASGLYEAVLTGTNGCDSTVTLSLTVLPISGTGIEASICTGETYEFNGETLTTGGVYTAVLTNANGCDSTITLNLIEFAVSQSTLTATICADETYLFDGEERSESGVYTAVYTNQFGCDSTVTLNLTVIPADLGSSLAVTICEESSYDFYGNTLTQSGIYTTVLTNVNGCDSTITLTLTVREPDLTLIEASICEGETYSFNGENLGAPGAYTALLTDSDGCDSLVILNLSVLAVSSTQIAASFCTGSAYTFNGDLLTSGGVYTAVLANSVGCDSTVTLTLTELPSSSTLTEATICEGESYSFEGQEYTESGEYTFTYTNTAGCDSVLALNLTVLTDLGSDLAVTICEESSYDFYGELLTQSGVYSQVFTGANGCDSTITLTLTVREPDLTLLEEFLCEGQSYLFNGENLTAPGEYTALLTDSDGCDSLIILNLMAAQPTSSEITGILCEGETYDFNGQTLTEGGVYTGVLTNAAGCDSTVTLTLLFREPDLTLLESSICEGETFLFNGENLTAPGAYSALLTNSDGCDSLVVLNLSVLPAAVSMIEASICQGSVYDFNGQILTESGIYVSVVSGANGCDSSIVLTLTTIQPTQTEFFATICEGESILFNGDLISAPGIYTATFTNTAGCDSLVILDLAVAPTTSSLTEAIICSNETYNFNGIEFSQAGTYIFVLTNEVGCDSIATLNLEVQPAYSVALEAKICAGESYEFGGADITESGLYTAAYTTEGGCDSIVVLNLSVTGEFFEVQLEGETLTASAEEGATYKWIDCSTNEPIEGATTNVFTPTVSGIYAVIVSLSDCELTSECTEVIVVSTENPIQEAGWQLLPNPTSGPAQLRMDQVASEVLRLQVFDMAGRLCAEQIIAAGQSNVSVDLSSLSDGMFLARLTSGSVATKMQRVVKVSK